MNDIEKNKVLVVEAMTSLFQHKDAEAVARLYAPHYVQHNPMIPQGRAALAALVARLPADLFYEPGLMVAEGPYVAIHGRIRGWAPKPQIVVDIFRVEDGLLAEHWDVLQDEVAEGVTESGTAMFSADERSTQRAGGKPASPGPDSTLSATCASPAPIDYDGLMRANLDQVFGEPDAGKRLLAIRRLYAPDAVLNEPHRSVEGHAAINEAVSELLASLPPHFSFRASGPAQGHHGIGVLNWGSGPRDGAFAVTGMDVAHFQGGVIHSLSVFLMPPNGA